MTKYILIMETLETSLYEVKANSLEEAITALQEEPYRFVAIGQSYETLSIKEEGEEGEEPAPHVPDPDIDWEKD